jgi:hypothetical protein
LVTVGTEYRASGGWTDIQCWADVYGRWGRDRKDESGVDSAGTEPEQVSRKQERGIGEAVDPYTTFIWPAHLHGRTLTLKIDERA